MTNPPLSVWRQEYSVDSDVSSFEADIPIIADEHDWHGWAWIRSSPTWIEVEHVDLAHLDDERQCYLLLLCSKSDPSHQIAIYPVSSSTVYGTLRLDASSKGNTRLQLQARSVSNDASKGSGKLLVTAVSSKGTYPQPWQLVEGCVESGRQWLQRLSGQTHDPTIDQDIEDGPLDKLSFCTWTSLGETTRPTFQNLRSLCRSLASSRLPIQSFLIDAGWQSTSSLPDTGNIGSDTIQRKLVGFEPYDGLGASLKEVVEMIKKDLPVVKDVGTWMTLQGFWCAIDPQSPLVDKYSCKPYPVSRQGLPGVSNELGSISYIDPSSNEQAWYLPPPDRAYDFWLDWLTYLASQGVSWIKVDNQASMSILAGIEGAECGKAMWDGMVRAARAVFGEKKGTRRVLHCMSHSERMFNGDIGLGLATGGQKILMRNTDDYGRVWLASPHADHIFQNLYSSLLTTHLCVKPDGDMFMSLTEAPVFQAVLRALMPGSILLTDKEGEHDAELIGRFVGQTQDGTQVVLKTEQAVRPLQGRLFEQDCRSGGGGVGKALIGSVHIPELNSAILGCWNVRENAIENKVDDHLISRDLSDALPDIPATQDYLVYKPGWCSDPTWALWTPSSRDPSNAGDKIMRITLNHLAAETVLLVPTHQLQHEGTTVATVALCGLVDKLAGIVAVADVKIHPRANISCRVACTGTFALAIHRVPNRPVPKVFVDGKPVKITTRHIDVSGDRDWTWTTFPIQRQPEAARGDGQQSRQDWEVSIGW